MRLSHFSAAIVVLATTVAATALLANRPNSSQPAAAAPAAKFPDGWQTDAPREEIRPAFAFDPAGGPKKDGAFIIAHDERDGLHGYFHTTVPVTGGNHYRFHAARRVENVATPRRSCVVRILWRDDRGKSVPMSEPPAKGYLVGFAGAAEAEHPMDKSTDAAGWTEVSDTYQAPPKATRAVVELHFLWAPRGKVEWADVSLKEVPKPEPRRVRLATVHYRPTGKSPQKNCEEFAPLIAKAASGEGRSRRSR